MAFLEIVNHSVCIWENRFGIGRSLLQEFVSPEKAVNMRVHVTFSRAGNNFFLEWTT